MTKYLGPVLTLVFLAVDIAGSVWLATTDARASLIATIPLGAILVAMVVMNDWPKTWKPMLAGKQ